MKQVKYVEEQIRKHDWVFIVQDYRKTIKEAGDDDVLYCDPPYIGRWRHTNYYNTWTERDEYDLYNLLRSFNGKFILSTWYRDKQQENVYIRKLWSNFNIITREHLYIVSGSKYKHKKVVEALVLNYNPKNIKDTYRNGNHRVIRGGVTVWRISFYTVLNILI